MQLHGGNGVRFTMIRVTISRDMVRVTSRVRARISRVSDVLF